MVVTVLLIVALILFLLAAISWPPSPIQLGWLGLFFITLAALLTGHVITL